MTFSRAKPSGWSDDISTITATEINTIDLNQSRAIDGTGGGTYTPSGALTFGGAGGVTIANTNTLTVAGAMTVSGTQTLSGQLVLSGSGAAILYRVLSLPDSNLTVLGRQYDVLLVPSNLTATRLYTLTSTGAQVGHVVRIVRADVNMGNTAPSAFGANLDLGGTGPWAMRPSKWSYVHVLWTGSQWQPVAWSPTTIDLANAVQDSWS
jgi:hypothetical protein